MAVPVGGLADLRRRKRRDRRHAAAAADQSLSERTHARGQDPIIGCILLRDVRFFPPDDRPDPPKDFARNLVQSRGFDLATHPEAGYFRELIALLLGHDGDIDPSEPWHRPGPVYGDRRLARQRLGQRAFKAVVLNANHRRCAITGSRIGPVLEAAHIRPVSKGGEHRLDNGLLLRSDVHTLFDCGYLGVGADHRLLVSPRLRDEDEDGEEFYRRRGQRILCPTCPETVRTPSFSIGTARRSSWRPEMLRSAHTRISGRRTTV